MSLVQRQLDHTIRVGLMTMWHVNEGHKVVIKDWNRSAQEQHRIFIDYPGVTKCDGYLKVSSHQNGLATDFVLFDENNQPYDEWPIHITTATNQEWIRLGGLPMISWDQGHRQSP